MEEIVRHPYLLGRKIGFDHELGLLLQHPVQVKLCLETCGTVNRAEASVSPV